MRKETIGLKAAIMFAAVVGMAQASPITLSPTSLNSYNLTWQDIKNVSYTWNDVNHDNKIEVGETVHLNVTMEKNCWGTHDYDAMKLWVDGTCINTPNPTNVFDLKTDPNAANKFMWDYNKGITDYTNESKYSYKHWNGINDDGKNLYKTFSFDYNFTSVGVHDLIAGVMCSRDLSGLYGSPNDVPTIYDWNNWNTNTSRYQGQTNKYQIQVCQASAPEPSSFSLMLLGLSSLAGSLLIRRKNK